MELKHELQATVNELRRRSNCTLVELKLLYEDDGIHPSMCSNCTLVELKLR